MNCRGVFISRPTFKGRFCSSSLYFAHVGLAYNKSYHVRVDHIKIMHEPSEFEYLQFAQGGAHPSLLVLGAVEITKPDAPRF
jgi:hypothetical protein